MKDKEGFVKAEILIKGQEQAVISESISREDNRIILSGKDFPLLEHGLQVELACYSEEGLRFMSGEVTLSTPYQVNLNILHEDDPEDRRSFIRVRVHNRTQIFRGYSMGKLEKPFHIGEAVELRDINIGGVGFYSNRRFLRGQRIEMDFGFLKKDLAVRAQILRIERPGAPQTYRFKYGCAFRFKSPEEERLVCEHVFRVQIDNRRKAMDLDEE